MDDPPISSDEYNCRKSPVKNPNGANTVMSAKLFPVVLVLFVAVSTFGLANCGPNAPAGPRPTARKLVTNAAPNTATSSPSPKHSEAPVIPTAPPPTLTEFSKIIQNLTPVAAVDDFEKSYKATGVSYKQTVTASVGRLSLIIRTVKPGCHSLTAPITLEVVFGNLTGTPLVIQSNLYTKYEVGLISNLSFFVFTADMESFTEPYYPRGDFFPYGSWYKFTKLEVNQSTAKTIDFRFPDELVSIDHPEKKVTSTPGNYWLKTEYSNSRSSGIRSVWMGKIESNLIQICLTE